MNKLANFSKERLDIMLKGLLITSVLVAGMSSASAHMWTEDHDVGTTPVQFFINTGTQTFINIECTVAPGGDNPDLLVQFWLGGMNPSVPYKAYPGMVVTLGRMPFQVSTAPASSINNAKWDQTVVNVSCRGFS